jgi:WD40 repeat protein
MDPRQRRPLTEALPPTPFGRFATTLVRILLVGLLSMGMATSSHAQARPPIEWMRGVIAGSILKTAVSPDGSSLAMSGTDGTVRIRRLSDGMLLQTLVDTNVSLGGFGSTPPTVNSFVYTSDGKQLVTGNSAAIIHVWDLASGTVTKTFTTPASVNAIALSPDGNTLAVGMTVNDISLYNFSDFSSAGTLGGHTGAVTTLAFSPDSKELASGSADKSVHIWKIANATSLITLPQGNSVTSVAFSPDNVTVCSGDSNAVIKIWNSSSVVPLHTITGPTSLFNTQSVALAISPDGTRLAGGYLATDTKLHLWNISSAAPVATADTTFPIVSVVYAPDGSQIYSTDSNNHIDAWSSLNLAAAGTLAIPFTGSVKTVVTNPAGTVIATGSYDGVVRFWDPLTGNLLTTLIPASGTNASQQINALAYSADGTTLAIAGLVPNGIFNNPVGIIWIYNIPSSQIPDPTPVHTLTLTASSVTFTPDGKFLAAGTGSNINVYRTDNLALQPVLTGHTSAVNAIAISPDGTTLASASSDRTVKIWNLSTSALVRTLSRHTGGVNSVAFSPASNVTLVDSSSDNTATLWSIANATATALQTFTHTDTINMAAFSRDGKQVATGGADRHLKIWDTATGAVLRNYTQETGAPISSSSSVNGVTSVVYSQDGKFLFYGRNDWTLTASDNPLFVPLITGLTLNPSSVVGGTSVTGTVTLNSTTLAGGAVISLSSDNTGVASLPASTVTVPQGSATATFIVNTSGVTVQSIANITASLNGSSATAPITVTTPTVLSLSLSPTSVRGGQNSTGTVTLTGPAPAGGLTVNLASNNTNAIAPAKVNVAAGASSATFSIPTNVVGTQNTATITASLNGTSATATLTITPPVVTAISVSPANLKGGQPSTGTVTISDPAPAGGILITLSSDNAAVAGTVGSVTVASGSTTATFAITTHVVSVLTSVTFTGVFNASSQKTVLTVTPPTVNTLTLSPASVKGGVNSTGTVTISDPAPAAGVAVTLSSANSTVAGVPTSVTIPSGSTTATFPVTTTPVTTDTPVVLTAAIGTGNATGTITVQTPALVSFALNPTNVRAFSSSSGIVTLDAVAPTGGTTVTLTSPNPNQASMPATVTVPAGATTVTFPITTGRVTSTTSLILSATLGTVTQTATLVISPALPFDFDGDGHNDLVFQNSQTGVVAAWFMNGLSVLGASTVNTLPQAGWQVRGAADFNHDGHPDLVLQNQTTGQVVFWYLSGTTLIGGEATSVAPGADYKVVGTGDFNNDGNVDLVFQNQKTGAIVFWFMQGAQVIGGATLPLLPSVGYNVVGVGDFNGDGHPDLLFQNANTGQVVVWYMNGVNFAGGGAISYFPPLAWQVKGVADYNNDGIPDIVFQNSSTNQVLIWFMNGLTVTGGDLISIQPPAAYRVVGPH